MLDVRTLSLAILLQSLIFGAVWQTQTKSTPGTVRGWVRDAQNRAVVGASVMIYDPEAVGSIVDQPVFSDAEGYFDLRNVRPGKHLLLASKESAGFGDTSGAFMAVEAPPMLAVEVHSDEQVGPIVINVGIPRGRLVCHAISAVGGAAVAVRYRLSITSAPEKFSASGTDVDGSFERAVPPVPVSLEVSDFAGAYETVRITSILVPLESEKAITIRLTPRARRN